jgi:two-component system CheB/CheR fusion protein
MADEDVYAWKMAETDSSPMPDRSPGEAPPFPRDFAGENAAQAVELSSLEADLTHPRLPIVGLGGSAGSIQALQAFFTETPPDSGAAYVVVVHLSPDHTSLLAELLQRSTRMPVIQVQERTRVEANSVYVIPPARQLSMIGAELVLTELDRAPGRRVAIDLFFRSLADAHGAGAAAIILSGGDADGTIGIKRMKERGGLTIAQDPEQAQHEGMPRAAIATGMIDWILPVEAMPGRLMAYFRAAERLQLPDESAAPSPFPAGGGDRDGEGGLRDILTFLRARTGRDFSYYKRGTVLRRVARRMQVNSVEDLAGYLAFLRTHPGETPALLQDLLISVTNFFRDRASFQALEEIVPKLFEGKGPTDQVRVWTAACATGEEAYSIAFLLAEYAATLEAPPSIQVFATDIDENAISSARQGVYPETILADISEDRLQRFFTHEYGRYRVKKFVRETVLFALHDVLKDAPFSRLDLISCRNLLIYLNREAQTRAFEIFHFALRPRMWLFLGGSESVDEGDGLFEIQDKKNRLFTRSMAHRPAVPLPFASFGIRGPSHLRPEISVPPATHPPGSTCPKLTPPRERFSVAELHYKLIDRIAPPSLIVDRHHRIVHLSEGAGRYLHLAGGEPTMDLLRTINPQLRLDLRAALLRAGQEGAPVEITHAVAEIEGVTRRIDITVQPAQDLAPDLMLVVFHEKEEAVAAQPTRRPDTDGIIRQLEQENEHLREQLREMLEQQDAGTEELKASNEELQAMNEELRSATEELDTGREELQSINEELTTVNQELKSKVDEAARSMSDLQNLMSATNIPTIFLDRTLNIQRFTPSAAPLFNLLFGDIGRPLSDLTPRLNYPEIGADARRVVELLTIVERETLSEDGRWFLVRLRPYLTGEERINGVVMTFVDITQRKQSEDDLRKSSERYRHLFNSIDEGFCVLEMIYNERQEAVDFRLLETNPAFTRLTGLDQAEGKRMLELVPDFQPGWIRFYGEVATTGKAARIVNQGVNDRWFDAYAFRISDQDNRKVAVLFDDITESRRAEEKLRETLEENNRVREEFEIAAKAKDHFLAVLSHELRTPLTPVLMTVGTLARRKDLPPRVVDALEMIRRNVEIEAHFIDDLLDLTRISRRKFDIVRKTLDLHEAIRAGIEISQPDLIAKNQELAVALDATRHHLVGDFSRLQQVVWNLLKNASKFTPERGKIRIATRNDGNRVQIVISDNGRGIEAESLARIFEAFTQGGEDVAREFGGLGLGLAISKATIDSHEGAIKAESAGTDRGATFTVDLPLG